MTSHKIAVKFFIENPAAPAGSELVPVFHSWIQTHAVADHLPIDVADYQHVKDGPGTLLITHEANFSLDGDDAALNLSPSPSYSGERVGVRGRTSSCAFIARDTTSRSAPHPIPLPRVRGRGDRSWAPHSDFVIRICFGIRGFGLRISAAT